ncbi:MAG: carbohydrate porin [Phycisphaerae bacterium]
MGPVRLMYVRVILIAMVILAGSRSPVRGQTTRAVESSPSEKTPPKHHGFFDLNAPKMTGDWAGFRPILEDHGVKWSLAYQQQGFGIFHGGRDTGRGYRQSGSYDLILKLDSQKLGLWKGGYSYIKVKGNWREAIGFNAGKVGGLSRPNADEGSDDTIFISKWWVGQRFLDGAIDLRAGRLESKKDLFDRNRYAQNEDYLFINTWFRANPTVPHTTAGGARLKIKPADWIYFQMGAFDGNSKGSKHGALRTSLTGPATFIGMWELGLMPKLKTARGMLPGTYRFGLWYDGRDRRELRVAAQQAGVTRLKSDSVGFYLSFDQLLYKENDTAGDQQGLGAFLRYGSAQREVNRIDNFWSLGVQYQGLIPKRDTDVLGLGVAQSILSDRFRKVTNPEADRETVYELYYKIEVTPWLAVTPDLQFLTNPGGVGAHKDTFVGGVRLRFLF